jgi:hypothetical protein
MSHDGTSVLLDRYGLLLLRVLSTVVAEALIDVGGSFLRASVTHAISGAVLLVAVRAAGVASQPLIRDKSGSERLDASPVLPKLLPHHLDDLDAVEHAHGKRQVILSIGQRLRCLGLIGLPNRRASRPQGSRATQASILFWGGVLVPHRGLTVIYRSGSRWM